MGRSEGVGGESVSRTTRDDGPRSKGKLVTGRVTRGTKGAVPGLMSFQGTLTDEFGVAMDTTVSMAFSIYTGSTGGTLKWTETQPAVVVSLGARVPEDAPAAQAVPVDAGRKAV